MPIDQIQTLPYASIDDRQRQPSSFDVFDSSYSNNYYQQSRIPPNQSCGQAIYYDYTPSRTPSLSQNVRLDQDIRQGPIMMTDPSSYGYEDMQDRRRGRRPAPGMCDLDGPKPPWFTHDYLAYGLWQPVQQPRYSGFQETYEHQPRGMMQGGFERPRIGNSGMPQPTTHQYFQDTRQEQGDYSANRNDISRGRDSRLSEELPRGSEFNNEHYSGQSLQENYTGLRRRQIMDLPHLHSQSRMSPEKVGRLHGNGQRGASLTLQPPSYPLGRDILHDGGNGFSLAQERARVNRQGLRYPGDPVTAMALPSRQNPGPSNSPRPSAAAVQSAIASGLNWDSWGLTENYLMETSDVPKKRAVFDVPKYQIAGFGEDSIDGHALEEDEESNSTITSLADEASQEGDGSNMSGSGQDFEVTAQGVAPGTKPEESNKKPRGTGSRGGIGSRGGKGSRGGIGSRRGKGSRGGMGSRGGKGAGGRPKKIRLAEVVPFPPFFNYC